MRSLRAELDERGAAGKSFTLKAMVGVLVPLCGEAADLHEVGKQLYLHPSSVVLGSDGDWHVDPLLSQQPPEHSRDKACMAPEEREGKPGNARASVYAVGAMAYELITGLPVGPGMERPSSIVPTLPPEFEALLAKALVADPTHRPDDLRALAQALHHMAPSGSIAPPPADESHLDADDGFEVDISMSMMPPPASSPGVSAASPYDMSITDASAPSSDHKGELSQLKERLESDKRPRYVVIKDGMDHGPFAAVELLHQIANHTFVEDDVLRDAFSRDERAIKDWDEFAPFAEHARLHRDHKAEKEAIERVVVEEKKSTRGKALVGLGVVGALLVGAGIWFAASRGARSDEVAVQGQTVTNVEGEGALAVSKKKGGGNRGGGVVGTSGGSHPVISGGQSCESAQAKYVESYNIGGGEKVKPDLTAGAYGAVLNRGSYLNSCGVPSDMSVSICAAVQNGRAVGVTVVTTPRNAGIASCVAGQIRGMSFPSHPRLDVTRTTFAAQ